MRIGDTLRKAAGLFVELPESQPDLGDMPPDPSDPGYIPASASTPAPVQTKTVEEIVRDHPGPNLDEIKIPDNPQPVNIETNGKNDFSQVYKMANLPASPFSAEQVLDLI